MPTGYTAKLMEEGQSFPDFVMLCARAMGACIMMRDDPLDATIPKRFEPSDYHQKRLKEAHAERVRLNGMKRRDRIAYGKAKQQEDIASHEKWLAQDTEQNNRLHDMEQKVIDWNPPTKDHAGLKAFMLEQIGTSKNRLDYIEKILADARAKSPMDYYHAAVKRAERDIDYHGREHGEEVERANKRTEWVQQLRASIP